MAAPGVLHEPGSEYGPCPKKCSHTDCAFTRRIAQRGCVHCGQPIGYGVGFYNVTPDGQPVWTKLAHQDCELRS